MLSSPLHKLAVVSGATGGIGSDVCAALARREYSFVLVGRSAEKLEASASKLTGLGARCSSIVHDFETDDVWSLFPKLSEAIISGGEYEYVSFVLAHGYGVMEPLHMRSPEDVRRDLSCNYLSFFALVDYALSLGMANARVRVVLLSSCLADVPAPFSSTYCAAKAGLDALCARPCGPGGGVTSVRASPVRGTRFYDRPGLHGGCAVLRALRLPALSVRPERVTRRILRVLEWDEKALAVAELPLVLSEAPLGAVLSALLRALPRLPLRSPPSTAPLGSVAWACALLGRALPAAALVALARVLCRVCQGLGLLPGFGGR